MSTEDALNSAARQFNTYLGLPILIAGVIGGLLNIIVFTTLKTFRETICAVYLTTVSLVNIGQLLTTLLVRVLSEGFQTDFRKIPWVCKIQIYMAVWCALSAVTIMCLATIDQFLSMSKYRHFSNLRFVQRCICTTCIFWGVYCIFILVYADAPLGICYIVNPNVTIYISRFQFPVLLGFLPISIMSTFSMLAFYNARILVSRQVNIVRVSRDRQLTAMTLVHVAFVVITTLPYTIFYIYSRNQYTTNRETIARNNLITTITLLITYSSYAGSFYIYCFVSKRFRKQLVYVLFKISMSRWRGNEGHNQVVPHIEIPAEKIRRVSIEVVSIQ